ARRSSPRPTAAREAKGAAGPPAARPRGRTPHPPVSVPLPSSHAGGDELLETHRLAFARGCARLDAGKAARLDEPLPPRRQLPAALHRVARVPAHRLLLHVHHPVMRIVKLDAVPLRIVHITAERVNRTT